MRLFRNPLYNRLGGFRRVPYVQIPRLRFRGRLPSPPVFCPEAGREIAFAVCLECPKFRVWNAQDGDFKRCWTSFKALEARGYYDGTWDDHPENFDPQSFAEIQERKKINAEFAEDFERDKAEMAELAKALGKEFPPSYFSERPWLNETDEEGESDESDEPAPADEDDDQ
jgi:hypothetical protein